ncbi:MAG: hypothetical protein KJ971_04330 [Firmicutes bacterium]|nr:hypothetical protein [Bacillota bacterium]
MNLSENLLKKRFLISLAMLIFSLSLFVFASFAWFTQMYEDSLGVEVGFVDVNIDAYFINGVDRVEAVEVLIGTSTYKPGVYSINIISNSSSNYFENFRLDIEVLSNVDTYLRVKIYEQLTLTYTNFEGIVTELSILNEEYMPFTFATTDWYYLNRSIDNYIYYTSPVQRTSEVVPLTFELISEYTGSTFSNYSPGYSLQIAFSIEAVQALGGPENVWGLATPPWDTEGSWIQP